MHGNTEKHRRLSLVQVGNVYWLLEFSLSTRGERDTIFTMLTVPSNPTNARSSRSPQTGLASPSFKSQLASPRDKSQLTAFFQNHQESQPIASRHDVIHTPVSSTIRGFYYDICDYHILRVRVQTVLNVCTCTCTKPNSSKPNQTEW